jgi:predicted nucleotidyltransferase
MKYGLTEDIISKIQSVLASFDEIEEAVIYGSRAKGNYKPASDIDLTLKGEKITLTSLANISYALDNLLLPYTFDLSVYSDLKQEDILDHIYRVGQVFYQKNTAVKKTER